MNLYKLGIDAINIRAGGGITHLSQLLSSAQPLEFGINKIVVWSGHRTLEKLPDRKWLEKVYVPLADMPLPARVLWQRILLPKYLRRHRCDALFSPGGTLPRWMCLPTVAMSQNLLPFEIKEMSRFPFMSFMRMKMHLLRRVQVFSMKRADGLIFLSRYARDTVLPFLRCNSKNITVIPHGIDNGFYLSPRTAGSLSSYSFTNPFRVLYVSAIHVYKHQWNVAKAVVFLRKKGFPIIIDFVGESYKPSFVRLRRVMNDLDPTNEFLHYKGYYGYEHLPRLYQEADAFVFASSCENLPNILLEAMASGLPIACSNRGPMPEVLGASAVYFDPEKSEEIELALQKLLENPDLRYRLASEAYTKAKNYSWEDCARKTFSFISSVIDSAGNNNELMR